MINGNMDVYTRCMRYVVPAVMRRTQWMNPDILSVHGSAEQSPTDEPVFRPEIYA